LVEEGETATILVARNGGSEGDVSVKWEILTGSTDSDDLLPVVDAGSDITANAGATVSLLGSTAQSGSLTWGDGESQAQSIRIPVLTDTRGEPKESFFVRLHEPTGSLSLQSPSIAVVSIEASSGTDEESIGAVSKNAELTYAWAQLSGTAVSITQSDGLAAEFTAPDTASELSFRLTVTNDSGFEAYDSVAVNVVVPPPPPQVISPPTQSGGGGGCSLSNSSSNDSSLPILLLIAGLLMSRRLYRVG
jgi:hypothetical protein